MVKLRPLLAAALPVVSVASTFRPGNGHGYLPFGSTGGSSSLLKHDAVLTRGVVDVDVKTSALCKDALSYRGGEGATNVDIPKANELMGAAFFTLLQIALNKVFVANGISFPAMLGCTIVVFTVLVLAEAIFPGAGEDAFQLLTPGSNLLTKWLPVMFVPGLAMLPLAPSIGSAVDVVKVLSMIVIGFGFTMSTTAFLVLGMRTAQGLVEEKVEEPVNNKKKAVTAEAPPPPPKPFSDETYKFLLQGTALTGAISVAATRQSSSYATPLRTLFMFFGTVLTYVFGARLPSGFTKVVHPLVTSTAGTLLLTRLDALATGSSFEDVLKTYKSGSLSPTKTGAGDLLLFLLGPAVGCLSVPMYSRKKIMADNLIVVIAAMICSSVGGLFGTAWYVRLLSIGTSAMVRLSLLSRNVTTGLAIVITQILEGNIAIAASVVVLTGIFGATVGRAVLDLLKIDDPVSRGLGMGAAGQGLGVAAMMPEKDAFPFAAINMVLTAVCATALVSIPAVRESLVNIVSAGLGGGTD
jgi:putative effector of murein hydrolase